MPRAEYMCAFCGEGVEDSDIDPCALIVVARFRAAAEDQQEQQFTTHATCLKKRLHPEVAAVAYALEPGWDGEF